MGDYTVTLSVDGEKASKSLEIRTIVQPAPVWEWLGIGLIGVVIGGMAGLFAWLGRH